MSEENLELVEHLMFCAIERNNLGAIPYIIHYVNQLYSSQDKSRFGYIRKVIMDGLSKAYELGRQEVVLVIFSNYKGSINKPFAVIASLKAGQVNIANRIYSELSEEEKNQLKSTVTEPTPIIEEASKYFGKKENYQIDFFFYVKHELTARFKNTHPKASLEEINSKVDAICNRFGKSIQGNHNSNFITFEDFRKKYKQVFDDFMNFTSSEATIVKLFKENQSLPSDVISNILEYRGSKFDEFKAYRNLIDSNKSKIISK
ncbi:MAG: hypothetical protein BGO27_04740 [Alphaproteobacteria bacterium 33-17]|nr:MAG: hypothetical protein BGO27_04740 [Alphaproteobacteria bacterium 33-17]